MKGQILVLETIIGVVSIVVTIFSTAVTIGGTVVTIISILQSRKDT
ncbi:MAG: hypothetical protein J6A75_03445 [Lachnospiraceae bacterium]|nr:hypothetical protein [Lachnospiraceae bacterium]